MSTDSEILSSAAAVEAVALAHLIHPDPKLDNALSNSTSSGLPPISILPLQGQFLAIQCRLIGAKSVLEIGTLGGYSTIWFAKHGGARVTSIEINPHHRNVALENTAGLDVEILLGDALEVLSRLSNEGRKFDFVFIDADWGRQSEYFDWGVKLTRPNGCIYVDNVARSLLDSGAATEAGVESVITTVGRDKRVTATHVPTLFPNRDPSGVFDGFLMAVVHG